MKWLVGTVTNILIADLVLSLNMEQWMKMTRLENADLPLFGLLHHPLVHCHTI